jgi:predicted dehydrogenase
MDASRQQFSPVGYGLAGFGRFCRNRLIPAFRQITQSRLVALYKRDADQARAAAQEYGIPPGYGDLRALLNDPQVEAVYVTSANSDHEWQAVAAAQAGKHVLVEKPLAVNADACRNIIAACEQAGVKLMVAHTLRFSPAVLQVKRWIAEERLGRIRAGRTLFTCDGTKSPRNWLYDKDVAGGGALMDIGVHCIDTLRFLLGEVAEFSGILEPLDDPVERSAMVDLRFVSGALGGVFCSFETPYRSRLEILGERGWAWVDSFTLPWAKVTLHLESEAEVRHSCLTGTGLKTDKNVYPPSSVTIQVDTNNPYGALLDSFSRSIRGFEPVAIPGDEGLKNQLIIDGLYSSRP